MKTWVLCFSRRKLFEWTIRSRSRWNGVRRRQGGSSTRPVRRVGVGRQRGQPLGLLGPDRGPRTRPRRPPRRGQDPDLRRGPPRQRLCQAERRFGDGGCSYPCGDARGGGGRASGERALRAPAGGLHQCSGPARPAPAARGLREEADAVKGLRKPNAAAWALNQLARRRPRDVERLIATGKRLRTAQEALLGGGDPSALKRASAEERELVDKLTRDAAAVAGEAAATAGGSLEERIRDTLHAAALDEQTAAELCGRTACPRAEGGGPVRRRLGRDGAGRQGVIWRSARRIAEGGLMTLSRGRSPSGARRRRQSSQRRGPEERKAQREHAGAAKAAEGPKTS